MPKFRLLPISELEIMELRKLLEKNETDTPTELNDLSERLASWKYLAIESHASISRSGGLSKTKAKVTAARANAKKRVQRGGRPRSLDNLKYWTYGQIRKQLVEDRFQSAEYSTDELALIVKEAISDRQLIWTRARISTPDVDIWSKSDKS